jgi:hypothetical protein
LGKALAAGEGLGQKPRTEEAKKVGNHLPGSSGLRSPSHCATGFDFRERAGGGYTMRDR